MVDGYCSSPSQAVTTHVCCQAKMDSCTNDLLKVFFLSEEPPSEAEFLSPEENLLALKEYSDMKHSELVPVEDLSKPDSETYYLPMRGVIMESSTTTKLRVIFDASAKFTSGHSLNDVLLSGPVLFHLLTNILIKFRQHSIVMSADISKMFQEVSLHLQDCYLHRYVMKNEEGLVEYWMMTRVTFGVTSPFLVTQILRQVAIDHQQEFPEAAALIISSFYVDDCLTGAANLQ